MISAAFKTLKPALHALDAETAHTLTIKALATGLVPPRQTTATPHLEQTLFGLTFKNPVGIAAGFDKNAEALAGINNLGFGFIEAGTVTPRPQAGNPRPRVFRDIQSGSVINRMGFSGKGAAVFEANLDRYHKRGGKGIIGINIGKNRDTEDPAADYLALIERFAPKADYITINISSPNTAGLRDLQNPDFLKNFLHDAVNLRGIVCAGMRAPAILLKLAPDLTDEQTEELAAVLAASRIDGLIMGNTTLDRPSTLPQGFRAQTGGLSGPHVRAKSTALIKKFRKLMGPPMPIIGVGGIASAEDAYEKIRAGASLVQLYTALVFHGPALVGHINQGLDALLARDGFKNISEATGSDQS